MDNTFSKISLSQKTLKFTGHHIDNFLLIEITLLVLKYKTTFSYQVQAKATSKVD